MIIKKKCYFSNFNNDNKYIKKFFNENPKIVIYMVVNDDYFELAAVMMNSLRHLKIKYKLVVLYSNNLPNAKLSSKNQALLKKHLNVENIIDVDADWMSKIKIPNIKAYPALLSLSLFSNTEDDIIIYLDSDMLILKDFSDILKDLDDYHIHGSSPDPSQKYINCGMFCMTRGFLDKKNWSDIIKSYVKSNNTKTFEYGDQNIINDCCPVYNHNWYTNYHPNTNHDIDKFRIIHWQGMKKPNGHNSPFKKANKQEQGVTIMQKMWEKERKRIKWLP